MKPKLTISGVCAVILAIHLIWPALKFDTISLILVLVGSVPWLASVIRAIEVPGGFKIELQEVKAATEKVISASKPSTTRTDATLESEADLAFLRDVAKEDPNLALVGLRIEIERRLAHAAEAAGISMKPQSANKLLDALVSGQRVDSRVAAGLRDLIALGNQAAHGGEVSSNAALWALDMGPTILRLIAAPSS